MPPFHPFQQCLLTQQIHVSQPLSNSRPPVSASQPQATRSPNLSSYINTPYPLICALLFVPILYSHLLGLVPFLSVVAGVLRHQLQQRWWILSWKPCLSLPFIPHHLSCIDCPFSFTLSEVFLPTPPTATAASSVFTIHQLGSMPLADRRHSQHRVLCLLSDLRKEFLLSCVINSGVLLFLSLIYLTIFTTSFS